MNFGIWSVRTGIMNFADLSILVRLIKISFTSDFRKKLIVP